MRTEVRFITGLILVATSLAAPAHADSPPPAGYCISIKAFLDSPFDQICADVNDRSAPRPAAVIHQSIDSSNRQVAATVAVCAKGKVNLGRFRLTGVPSNQDFRVKYSRVTDGVDITRLVVGGTYVTRAIAINECFRYRIDVIRTSNALVGSLRTFSLTANPEGPGWVSLKAATRVRATYPAG